MTDRLTGRTTREEFLAILRSSYAASLPFGGNRAIGDHLAKVEAMTEIDWMAHRARLLTPNPARAIAVTRMADQLRRSL